MTEAIDHVVVSIDGYQKQEKINEEMVFGSNCKVFLQVRVVKYEDMLLLKLSLHGRFFKKKSLFWN